jgi:membrane protein implicated in regulation of membrane protease activity
MLWIIALALIAVGALALLSFTLHVLFSPWLLVVGISVVLWLRFRPRRSRR